MKLMYFMDNDQVLGGAAHTLLRQAELMKVAGHDVLIVLDNGEGKLCEAYEIFCRQRHMAILCMPLCVAYQPEDIDIWFALEHFEETKGKIEEEKPDILHSVQINTTVELAARELNIPHVMNIYPALLDFFLVDYVDVFPQYHICDSQYYADMWKKYIKTESVCIRTVADRGIRKKSRLKTGGVLKCICVGAVYRQKNQLSVIMACHKALKDGIRLRLHIYGNCLGNLYGEECINYIEKNNLTDHIEFKGFCSNMPEIYQESDVLLCGSTRESYPNVISEALANETVIISTPVAGVPEIISDQKNGYLCKGYTMDDLYEKILEVNRDIENGKIYEVIQRAAETYERVHSPESVTYKLEEYYQWILNNDERKEKIRFEGVAIAFSEIFNVYYRKEPSFSDKEKIQKKLWYLYHVQDKIKKQMESGKAIYIWGTGKCGMNVYELIKAFFEDMCIFGFVDSYKSGMYMDQLIYTPEEILGKEGNIVLVAIANGQSEILEQLKRYDKKYLEDYYLLAPRCW